MFRHRRIASLFLTCAATTAAVQAQTPDPSANGAGTSARFGRAGRAATPPTIDGRLDDAAWGSAPMLDGFRQHEPVQGSAVSERTEVRILFDDHALYLGAWLYDTGPGAIVRGEARRDVSLNDMDAFLAVFDTYRDGQNAFVFGTTPAGIEYDGQLTREGEGGGGGGGRQQAGSGGGLNVNWDGDWQVRTSADEAGWYAEFRIPFSTLRYPGSGPQTWGLNLARYIRRRNEQAFWSPVPRQFTLYRVSLAGRLDGLELPFRATLTATPYLRGTTRRNFEAGRPTDASGDLGGDLKIGLTPSLTLDLTANTDFAQVEVDEQQVNLTRFNLFFPEKRPFFLENAGTFAVGSGQANELFFSRRIGIGPGGVEVPLRGGGRFTGKVSGLQVGLLDLQTGSLDSTVGNTNYGAVRVLREFGGRTRLGVIATSRVNTDSTSDWGTTLGVDGRLGIGTGLTFDGYAAETRADGGSPGHSAGLGVSYTSRDWSASATGRHVGEGYDPEVGFLTRPEHRFLSVRVLRRFRFPGVAWFRELRPHVSLQQHQDLSGFIETRFIHVDSHFEFANGAFFQLPAVNFTREGLKAPFEIADGVVIPAGVYDNFEWGFAYNTNLGAPVSLQGEIDVGGFYGGRRIGGAGTLTARSGSAFLAALRFSAYDVDLPQGDFRTTLLRLRLSYAFTARMYIQSLLQYNNQSDQFSGNLRFGWLTTAGTGLFVVLNDLEAVEDGGRFRPQDRALIVKLTRQFRTGL